MDVKYGVILSYSSKQHFADTLFQRGRGLMSVVNCKRGIRQFQVIAWKVFFD